MKRTLFLVVILFGMATAMQAQEIKILPTNLETNALPDGWHKFELQGAIFDVEVLGGNYTKGKVTWFDGTSYSGGLSGAFISGKGTYTWANGSRYEGSFKKGKRHGKGSLILANGQKWSGKWKQNKKHGKGKVYDKEGEIVQQGVWEEDALVSTK